MKKYIIHLEPYMFESADMYQIEAESDMEAVFEAFGIIRDEWEDETDEEVLAACNDMNGDGQQYRTVYCVDDDRKVFG